MLLVTHHVEEILPEFTHALLLREGKVIASGGTEVVLESKRLSRVFGARCILRRKEGRYTLRVSDSSRSVV